MSGNDEELRSGGGAGASNDDKRKRKDGSAGGSDTTDGDTTDGTSGNGPDLGESTPSESDDPLRRGDETSGGSSGGSSSGGSTGGSSSGGGGGTAPDLGESTPSETDDALRIGDETSGGSGSTDGGRDRSGSGPDLGESTPSQADDPLRIGDESSGSSGSGRSGGGRDSGGGGPDLGESTPSQADDALRIGDSGSGSGGAPGDSAPGSDVVRGEQTDSGPDLGESTPSSADDALRTGSGTTQSPESGPGVEIGSGEVAERARELERQVIEEYQVADSRADVRVEREDDQLVARVTEGAQQDAAAEQFLEENPSFERQDVQVEQEGDRYVARPTDRALQEKARSEFLEENPQYDRDDITFEEQGDRLVARPTDDALADRVKSQFLEENPEYGEGDLQIQRTDDGLRVEPKEAAVKREVTERIDRRLEQQVGGDVDLKPGEDYRVTKQRDGSYTAELTDEGRVKVASVREQGQTWLDERIGDIGAAVGFDIPGEGDVVQGVEAELRRQAEIHETGRGWLPNAEQARAAVPETSTGTATMVGFDPEVAKGAVGTLANVGNVAGAALSTAKLAEATGEAAYNTIVAEAAPRGTELQQQAERARDAAVAGAIAAGAAAVGKAAKSVRERPEESLGSAGALVALGGGEVLASSRAARTARNLQGRARTIRASGTIDPEELTNPQTLESVNEGTVDPNYFPGFDERPGETATETFRRQASEYTPEELEGPEGEPALKHATETGRTGEDFLAGGEFEASAGSSEISGQFFGPEASPNFLRLPSAANARGGVQLGIPRFRERADPQIVTSRLDVDQMPGSINTRAEAEEFLERQRGDGTAYIKPERGSREVSRNTGEAEAIVAEGTRFVERGDEFRTRMGPDDTFVRVRQFEAVTEEQLEDATGATGQAAADAFEEQTGRRVYDPEELPSSRAVEVEADRGSPGGGSGSTATSSPTSASAPTTVGDVDPSLAIDPEQLSDAAASRERIRQQTSRAGATTSSSPGATGPSRSPGGSSGPTSTPGSSGSSPTSTPTSFGSSYSRPGSTATGGSSAGGSTAFSGGSTGGSGGGAGSGGSGAVGSADGLPAVTTAPDTTVGSAASGAAGLGYSDAGVGSGDGGGAGSGNPFVPYSPGSSVGRRFRNISPDQDPEPADERDLGEVADPLANVVAGPSALLSFGAANAAPPETATEFGGEGRDVTVFEGSSGELAPGEDFGVGLDIGFGDVNDLPDVDDGGLF